MLIDRVSRFMLIQAALVAFVIFVSGFFGNQANAYPSFIGYGYTTCVTCHYNSTGNGPLTDYGRGIFSQEIAARTWIPKSLSDEDLAGLSNFIPGMTKPSWFRPDAKYRGLWLDQGIRQKGEKVRFIPMERDLGATFLMGKSQRTIFTVTYGLLDVNQDYYGYGQKQDWISREHYFRTYVSKKLLVAAGLMDKPFGIKHEDHEAINRKGIGNGQEDQSHGILFHYFEQDWDVALDIFSGNLLREPNQRAPGASVIGEYLAGEENRLGMSALTSSSNQRDRNLLAVHDRWGNTRGSSFMVEIGLNQLKDKTQPNASATLGNYIWLEGLMKLTRGWNILTEFERSQAESKYTGQEVQKLSLGILAFPFQRIETRLAATQYKFFSPESATDDMWALQGQIHVSL